MREDSEECNSDPQGRLPPSACCMCGDPWELRDPGQGRERREVFLCRLGRLEGNGLFPIFPWRGEMWRHRKLEQGFSCL